MEAFTAGYGGRVPDEFAKMLATAGVKIVVDVRLRPDRAAMGNFAKAGVGYVSLPELGNVFLEYDDWAERYAKFLDAAGPLLFDRLAGVAGPICLMCAEKRVCECHRRHVAEYLTRTRAWKFTHLE